MIYFTFPAFPNPSLERHDSEWIRQLDAAIVSGGLALVMKRSIRSDRPDQGNSDGFPSFHTTIAFSLATVRSSFHPKEAALWYPVAALVGVWRVTSREHTPFQALAGAALGYGIARWEVLRRNGLILSPIIGRRQFGLTFSRSF